MQYNTYIVYILHRISCGLVLPMDIGAFIFSSREQDPRITSFFMYKIIKLFVFSLYCHKTYCSLAELRRNMHYGALLRPPVNITAFVSKHPITKRMHRFLILPILNLRYISNNYILCIIHFV